MKAGISKVEKICLIVVAVVGLLTLSCYALTWIAVLTRPYSLSYEGHMLWAAVQLAYGKNIYPLAGLSTMPWTTILYPPLYPLLGAATIKLFGVTYFGLRLISILSLIFLATSFWRLLRLFQCRKSDAIVCLLFFLNFSIVSAFSAEAKPDMLALALAVFASERFVAWFLCRSKLNEAASRRLLSVCALIAALSCLVKQQDLVFGAAFLCFLLCQKMWKQAQIFLCVWLGTIFLVLAATEVVSGGFIANLTSIAGIHSQMKILLANLSSFGINGLNILVALCLVPSGIVLSKKLKDIEQLPLIVWIVSVLLMLYTMGIPATSINHALCPLFALTWLLALSMRYLPHWTCAAIAVLCLLNLPALATEGWAMRQILPYANASAAKLEKMNLAGKLMLTDDANLNYLTGSKPVFIDCAWFFIRWQASHSPMTELMDDIKEQKFACAIINSEDSNLGGGKQFWPEAVITQIKRYYKKVDVLYCSSWAADLYLPKSKSK